MLKTRSPRYDLSAGFASRTDLADEAFVPGSAGAWWTPRLDRKTLRALCERQDARPLLNKEDYFVRRKLPEIRATEPTAA